MGMHFSTLLYLRVTDDYSVVSVIHVTPLFFFVNGIQFRFNVDSDMFTVIYLVETVCQQVSCFAVLITRLAALRTLIQVAVV